MNHRRPQLDAHGLIMKPKIPLQRIAVLRIIKIILCINASGLKINVAIFSAFPSVGRLGTDADNSREPR